VVYLRALIAIAAILTVPSFAHAQEATLLGTVTDTTGAVLPGVTVTAVHEATGNTFEVVTDATGTYRIPVRVGRFRLTAQLAGFTTVVREGVELLAGREAAVNFELTVSTLEESITVTGEAPLVDVTRSSASGNIDSRQLEDIPVQGRDWQDLTMLAPGSRRNDVSQWAGSGRVRGGGQLNVDGQQVTTNIVSETGDGQPAYSRDAIAEFQFVTNRFDATQGRSTEMQVNVITKSGTNTFAGTAAGYFRSDKFNAADPVVGRVLPYSNQQFSTTLGGPIRQDKIHFFANYEYEREPDTFVHTTPWPAFNLSFTGTQRLHKGGGRVDAQFSPAHRLTVRGNEYQRIEPYASAGGGTSHPSANWGQDYYSRQAYGSMTSVLGNASFNELKAGWSRYGWDQYPHVQDPRPAAAVSRNLGSVAITMQGLSIGTENSQLIYQDVFQVRDDYTFSFTRGGRHDVKTGAEYIWSRTDLYACTNCIGSLDAQGGPVPANIEALFPVWNDASTWNLRPLSPISRSYSQGIGKFTVESPRHEWALWVQDDWRLTQRFTLNLGVRYDLAIGAYAEEYAIPPFLTAGRPNDTNNIAPRLGFAYGLNDMTVIRGGGGLFYGGIADQMARFTRRSNGQFHFLIPSDGRADFAANPFNGPTPTDVDSAIATSTARRNLNQIASEDLDVNYSYQASFGVQRQLAATMALEADYVYTGGRREPQTRNINLSYNPATGANYPNTDASRAPFPRFGNVTMWRQEGYSNYHALQTALTRRFANRWQGSATYTLSTLKDQDSTTKYPGCAYVFTAPGVCDVPVAVVPDLGGEYTYAVGDQRHRAVFNGIFEIGYGFQLSGVYFYGSGQRRAVTAGGDRRLSGMGGGRLRANGTLAPRNSFVGDPIHRVDMRLQQRIPLGGSRTLDGILEVFNVMNRANYGSYVTNEASAAFGQPQQSNNVAYSPRALQLGVRFAF
jgi:hypothetical protein